MKSKKWTVLFAAILVISLCACGGEEGGSSTKQNTGSKQENAETKEKDGLDGAEAGGGENIVDLDEDSEEELSLKEGENGADMDGQVSDMVEQYNPNERFYQNEDGYVKVIFEDGDYYEFFDYPNEMNGDFFWHCDWQVQKLEGQEQEREFRTGKDAEGSWTYQTIHATHELYYPMEYYENGLDVSGSYIFLNISEDTFTQINVDAYGDDGCYRINYFTYNRVQKVE